MIPQSFAIFCGVSSLLVVLTRRLWLRFIGSPPILFGHLKYDPFLIFSKTWCTSSLNTVPTTWVTINPDYPAKSLRGRLLLYLSHLKSLLSWGITLTFPFPYCWSSSTRLYSSIRSISWRTLLVGFLVNDFLKSCSAGRPALIVLIVMSSKFPSISLNISQYLLEYVFKVSPSHMVMDNK